MRRAACIAWVCVSIACAARADDPTGTRTPVGAEARGNADGTIPPWSGAPVQPPGFRAGSRYANPFADEAPLYVVTAANAEQHADRLSPAQRRLLAVAPTFRMPVYPTHRTAVVPAAVVEATARNAGRARLVGADGIEDAHGGFPFPQPRSGVEVLWNHRLRYRGANALWRELAATVMPNGDTKRTDLVTWTLYPYADVQQAREDGLDGMHYFALERISPIRNCGSGAWLWHEPLNPVRRKRQNWYDCAGWKSGRLPTYAYELSWGGGGLMLADMNDMFSGGFDRYTYRLLGKRELLIPYNAYRISDGSMGFSDLLQPRHLAPVALRYELHRVWVVDATLRPGEKHPIRRRTFYVDEDSWTIALVDVFESDLRRPSRLQEGHVIPFYDVGVVEIAPHVVYGLDDGRYFALRLIAEREPPRFNTPEVTRSVFVPGNIKRVRSAR